MAQTIPTNRPPRLKLHLEIGFGDGRFTAKRALNEAGHFVALEITNASIDRALRRFQREGVERVSLLKADAELALAQFFAPHSLESITINFPDPWPKSRHEDRRLLKKSFFNLAASRLKPQAEIRLATDAKEYLDFAIGEALASGLFRLEAREAPAMVFETKYALKWKGQGRPLYYQIFSYNGQPTPNYPILEREIPMPHALLAGEIPQAIPFSKHVIPYGNGHVILEEVSRSWALKQDRLLCKVVIDEKLLIQHLLVVVAKRQDGQIIVRFDSFADPIITKTAKGAIHTVSEWLLSLDQGLSILKRDYH
ncbi:MAG: hypothetical protein R2880_08480 [Deinococcales bacterium]